MEKNRYKEDLLNALNLLDELADDGIAEEDKEMKIKEDEAYNLIFGFIDSRL